MNDNEIVPEPVNCGQASGRRRLFRKLATLAALGISGALLGQEITGFVPRVHAQAANYLVIDTSNYGTGSTSLSSTVADESALDVSGSLIGISGEGQVGVRGNGVVAGTASNPCFGVFGISQGISQGVNYGVVGASSSSNGIGVLGWAISDNTIPLVAKANSSTQSGHLQEWQNSVGTALSVVDPKGRFGVGTTNPTQMVHIVGNTVNSGTGLAENLRVESNTAEVGIGLNNTSGGGHLWQIESTGPSWEGAGKLGFYDNTAGAWRMIIDGSGNVGIGTQNPAHLIQLSGGGYSDGTTWNPASSIRWKENVTPLTGGVETLKQLHPVSFNYKKTPSKRTMGFIAEEVGKILPTVVDWDTAEPGYAEGYDQTAILALAVQAIKELNDKLTTENNTLRERIEVLEHKLAN